MSRPEPDQAQVSVRDTGPGISGEHSAKLYETFWTSKPQGMGIGLAICRSIIESHGGRIWLANGEAGATTFRFTLPVAQPANSAPTTHGEN